VLLWLMWGMQSLVMGIMMRTKGMFFEDYNASWFGKIGSQWWFPWLGCVAPMIHFDVIW
jgi:hypothetical protein